MCTRGLELSTCACVYTVTANYLLKTSVYEMHSLISEYGIGLLGYHPVSWCCQTSKCTIISSPLTCEGPNRSKCRWDSFSNKISAHGNTPVTDYRYPCGLPLGRSAGLLTSTLAHLHATALRPSA